MVTWCLDLVTDLVTWSLDMVTWIRNDSPWICIEEEQIKLLGNLFFLCQQMCIDSVMCNDLKKGLTLGADLAIF